MLEYPKLVVRLDRIRHNAKVVTNMCANEGMEVIGVTKGVCGETRVARAMIEGGCVGVGDSRLRNLIKLREGGIKEEITMLRLPMPSNADAIVKYADISLNSEFRTISALSNASEKTLEGSGKRGRERNKHRIILMIDLGDLREGVLVKHSEDMVKRIVKLKGVELVGVGTNLACYGGVIPTSKKMKQLSLVANAIRRDFGLEMPIVSGGNSANLTMIIANLGRKRKRTSHHLVNQLRIGEGILLGLESVSRTPVPGTVQDAFLLQGEIIEIKKKPSVPNGRTGQDAFGNKPKFKDMGIRKRAIVAMGRQDISVEGLRPVAKGAEIMGASSDHLIVDITDAEGEGKLVVGGIMSFIPNYTTMLRAMTSPYVRKEFRQDSSA